MHKNTLTKTKKAERLAPVMTTTTYRKKAARCKKLADNFIKRANAYYHKLLKREANDANDSDLIQMFANDLKETMMVCYLVKAEQFEEAHDIWYNMDTDPNNLFPVGMTDLLDELSEAQYEYEKSGYRQC